MRHFTLALTVIAVVACAGTAKAQIASTAEVERVPKLRFGGIRIEPGLVNPENADTGFQLGGSVALGTIFTPWLHLNAGIANWSTDRSDVDGTISDFVVSSDLRLQPLRIWRLRPYLLMGLAAHVIGANIPGEANKGLEDALTGFSPGIDVGLGLRTNRSGLGGSFEIRRRLVNDVQNWTYQLGIGWTFGSDVATRPAAEEARTIVVPMTAPVTTVAPQPVATVPRQAVPDESLERIARAMRALADENRSLRSDVDSLRRSLASHDASGASGAASPVRTPAAPRVEETRTSRRTALGEALGRIPLVHENPDVIRETPSGYRLALTGDMAFASSRSELSVAAREALRQVALVMFRFQDSVGRIDGHADSWGTPEGNMRISVERAMAVRDELIRLGIDPERLIARGRGSESPVADNTTAEGRARNRRVEIYLDERQ